MQLKWYEAKPSTVYCFTSADPYTTVTSHFPRPISIERQFFPYIGQCTLCTITEVIACNIIHSISRVVWQYFNSSNNKITIINNNNDNM